MARDKTLCITAILCALILTGSIGADVIYVDDDAPSGGDGATWAKAYRFLQDALAVAVDGDEVRVGQGIYLPDHSSAEPEGTGDRNAYLLLSEGVVLRGGYAGLGASDPDARDVQTYRTILSGDLEGNDATITDPWDFQERDPTRTDNSMRVVTVDGIDPNTVVSGLVISGAYDSIPLVIPIFDEKIGGLYVGTDSQVTVRDCTFRENVVPAMLCSLHSQVLLMDCVFEDNINTEGAEGSLLLRGAAAHVIRCTFERNSSYCGSGGVSCYPYGGSSDLHLADCHFRYNASRWGWPGISTGGQWGNVGGGLFAYGSVEIVGCEFRGNSAGAGGAVSIMGNAIVSDCVFEDNHSLDVGGAMLLQDAEVDITRCVFSNNNASWGGAVYQENGRCGFVDSLFAGNRSTGSGGGAIGIEGYPLAGWRRAPIRQAFSGAFDNCTFADNTAPAGNAHAISVRSILAGNVAPGAVTISDSIFDDSGLEIDCLDTEMTIAYTNLRGGLEAIQDPCDGLSWGPGNIDTDSLFVEPGYWDPNGTEDDSSDDFFVGGDYHLKSQAGRWDAASESWVQDEVTSPCIDAGDPNTPIMYEPFPNGGIINMGAYGGTAEASKSYFGDAVCETIIAGDINGDCKVDINDLILLIDHWTDE